jgi:outer membrane receptor protein involved in Fe transport
MVRLTLAGVFGVAILLVDQANAQTSGAIAGVVRDPQGAVIVAATVDISCGAVRRRTSSSSVGEFLETNLPAGRCTVTAGSEEFEPETVLTESLSSSRLTLSLRVRRFASEVVVTPTRQDERAFEVPEALSVTSRRDLDGRPHALVTQALAEEPGVLLQQTSSAQTSPIIRGFTGQSNVYLVDGVRLNVGQWRTGPSQYSAWIEGGPVESIEVVRGGGSVQYGSDALGGTIQYLTTTSLASVAPRRVNGSLELMGASASEGLGVQGDLAFRAGSAMVRVGGSRQRVGELRAGKGLDSHSAIARYFGLPSTLIGSRLRATDFETAGAYGVATIGLSHGAAVRALFMHDTQIGASRYDRVLGGEGLFASRFDPQTLDLATARYTKTGAGIFDGIAATLSLNRQADGRFEQARPTARLDRQEAVTTALGYQVQANRDFGLRHQMVAGAEYYDESITASRELVDPGPVTQRARPDIPDGTTYGNFGVYAQHAFDVLPNRLSLRGGVRYSRFVFATTPDAALGVLVERVTQQSTTFQATAVVGLSDEINLTASVNRGFRAANAADLGSIGLTGGGGFEIAPSAAGRLGAFVGSTGATGAVSTGERVPGLGPEVVYQYEVGLKARTRRFTGAVSGFTMELYDFLQRRALVFDNDIVGRTISGFTVVRQDATGLAYIAQDVRPIATRVNVDRARVRGFDVEGEFRPSGSWTASAYFSLASGRILTTNEFVRRMNPPMGGAKLRWSRQRLWAEGVVMFAADQTRLNSADLTDARIGAVRTRNSIATFFNGTAADMGLVQGGVLVATGETLAQVQTRVLGAATSAPLYDSGPGFAVFGLRAGIRLTTQIDVTVLGENLGDVNYRLYGSGIDAPGINVQVRTRYRF